MTLLAEMNLATAGWHQASVGSFEMWKWSGQGIHSGGV